MLCFIQGGNVQLIEEAIEGQQVKSLAQVRSRQLRPKKNGELYLRMVLSDRSGRVEARMWDGFEQVAEEIREGDFVRYLASVEVYNGTKQFVISQLRKVSARDVQEHGLLQDLLPSTGQDISEMWEELLTIVDKKVQSPVLRRLLDSLLNEHEEEFCTFPAGVEIHHAYLGGFLEHVLSLARCAIFFGDHHQELDRDLLIAGAILHDIGKLQELTGPVTPGYTKEGRLIGHVVLGRDMLREAAARIPDFPEDLLLHLEHLIISHQGQLEWGAPRRPKTPEALALHYLDDLDAKLNRFLRILKQDKEDSEFTAYDRYFGRFLFKGRNLLDNEIPGPEEDRDIEPTFPSLFDKQ